MATRSSGGTGMLVALAIFIVLSLVFLLTTMIFYTKQQQALTQMQEANAALTDFVTSSERELDWVERARAAAERQNVSVVSYLNGELRQAMALATGDQNMTTADLRQRMGNLGLPEDQSLAVAVQALRDQVRSTQSALEDLQAELTSAQQKRDEEIARREELQLAHQRTIDAMQDEINRIQALADEFASRVQETERFMEERVTGIRGDYETQIAELERSLEAQRAAAAQLQDDVASLQQRIQGVKVSQYDEATLVDGEVVRVLDGDDVFINRGAGDNIVLGMTFEVYGSTREMRPDARGITPRGKATVEVTRIGDTTSTARVIRSTPGRAVSEGDIIVNAAYDPNKNYTFFVFGLFDLDGENGPSQIETEAVKTRIRDWGGDIRDAFSGDVDFVVLGVEPQLPPPLPPNPTPAQVRQWVDQRQFHEQYQEYLNRAASLSIPVLNQNRLLTLIGYHRR